MKKIGIYSRVFKGKERVVLASLFASIQQRDATVAIYRSYYEQIKHLAECPRDVTVYDDGDTPEFDLLITVGGDGTLLNSVEFSNEGRVPVIGINTGRLGFLTSVASSDVEKILESVDAQSYSIDHRSLLKLEGQSPHLQTLPFALNECAVMKDDNTAMICVDLYRGDEFMNSYWCDGLMVSTPTGSTGYSLSCGGPILLPDNDSWVITPLAPHNLSDRPIVVRDDKPLRLVATGRGEKFKCTLDARTAVMPFGESIMLSRAAFDLQVVRLPGYSFIDTTRDKLRWGGDTRNVRS